MQVEGWKRTRQAVSIKGRQAGWDLSKESARSTLKVGVRKASYRKPS